MPFFYLHNFDIKPNTVKDMNYILYSSVNYFIDDFITINEITYHIHEIKEKFDSWSVDDEIITILGNENSILVKFKKILNAKNGEMWINENML